MKKKSWLSVCLLVPMVALAFLDNEIDWRYGRQGIPVVTNAPTRAMHFGLQGRVGETEDAVANYGPRLLFLENNAITSAPPQLVTSVNGQTGAVTVVESDPVWMDERTNVLAHTGSEHGVNAGGGFAGGKRASVTYGGAVGSDASAQMGGAVGSDASTVMGGAVGMAARADFGGAVGMYAMAGNGFAGGAWAQVAVDGDDVPIDAVQLGEGVNEEERSLQVYEHKLMGADGVIPQERVPYAVSAGVVTGIVEDVTGVVWQTVTNVAAEVVITARGGNPIRWVGAGDVTLTLAGLAEGVPVYLTVSGMESLAIAGAYYVGGGMYQTNMVNHYLVWRYGAEVLVTPITATEVE